MAERAALQEQFEDLAQQREATELGMWIFLATELLFFGGLFLGYTVYRHAYPNIFAETAKHTDILIGTLNTAILLTSSLTAALAAKAGNAGERSQARAFLLATILLGLAFLGAKGYEYWKDVQEGLWIGPGFALPHGPAEVFFSFYWVMTFVHAIHVSVGISVFAIIYVMLREKAAHPRRTAILEVPALYWHLVDIIWIFLYPILYLLGRAS